MDLASLTIEALTTVVVTKGFEKIGESMGEGVFKLVTQFCQLLVKRIPRLQGVLETDPQKLLAKETVLEVDAEVIRDPELSKVIQSLLQAVDQDPRLKQAVQALSQPVQRALIGNEVTQDIEVDVFIQEVVGQGSVTQEAVNNNKVGGTLKIGKIQQTFKS